MTHNYGNIKQKIYYLNTDGMARRMATRTISTKLAVEGEAEYKQAIAACNSELTTLKSGFALVENEFRNNANSMEALASKGTALDSMYKSSRKNNHVENSSSNLQNAQWAQEEYAARVSTAKENIERCEKKLDELKNSTGDTTEEQKSSPRSWTSGTTN